MLKAQRQEREIMSYLADAPRISLAEAQALLGISESTVRRLFLRMESAGQAMRVHGALQAMPQPRAEYDYPSMAGLRLYQKRTIARAALSELGDATSVFLDSGSTVYQFSLCLADYLKAGRLGHICVFTNSVKNLQALGGATCVQFIGGRYREKRQDCCGLLAEEALSGLNPDLCVLGADGCTPGGGITCTDMETAQLGRIAVGRAKRRILLADSTKFRRDALVTYARLKDFDLLVTDDELDAAAAAAVESAGGVIRRAQT